MTSTTPSTQQTPGPRRGRRHQEWLLDEALKESFPASDPASPYLAEPTRALHGSRRWPLASRSHAPRQVASAAPLLLAGLAVLVGIYVGRRRR
jgi:hypothetical protein